MGKVTAFIFNRYFALALVTISLALLVGPVRAGLDENGYPDVVFTNYLQKNRFCLNSPYSFSCSDIGSQGNGSYGVAFGEMDGDNHMDFVIANAGPSRNRLCLGDGSGLLNCIAFGDDNHHTIAVALGDMDGDGDLEAVFANLSAKNRLCLRDSGGGFVCSDVSDDANSTIDVALGYVDGDQHLDAVFANQYEKSRLCLGDGSGGFDCRDLGDQAHSAYAVALGDLDGDGHLDAVFAADSGYICRGDGNGQFNCSNAGISATDVALGHLNDDGRLDAVLADYGAPNTVCLGAGDGGFSSCRNVSNDSYSSFGVALGDLDGDGYLDAVFANGDRQKNMRCLGDGSGGFNCSPFSEDTNETTNVAITNDGQAPQVVDVWLVIGAGGTANQINQIAVRFSENVVDGDGPQGAENPHNYLATLDGVPLTISSVDYSPQHRTAILTLAEALGDGEIAVTVMGSTSIVDIDNHKLDGGSGTGSDFTLAFSMDLGLGGGGTGGGGGAGGGSGSGGGRAAGAAATASSMPGTGFAPGVYTPLAAQPEAQAYRAAGDLRLEVPSLGIDAEVMGVPFADGEWDVSWLGARVGWLEGSAYPATAGNTALTGHLVDNNGRPGPFARLGELSYGDTLVLHSGGNTYTYSVRESLTVLPDDTSPLGHEDYDWLTLIICQGYDEASGHYGFRRVVRAVLVQVSLD